MFSFQPLSFKMNVWFYNIDHFRYPNQWREIAIDPQVKTATGQIYDIIFIGTDKVETFINSD